MRKVALMMVLLLALTGIGCESFQVKPTVTESGPGVEIVIGGETAEKINEGVSKLEGFLKIAGDMLPILVGAADKIGDATGNEDLGEDAEDTAEDVAAGLGLLTLILGVVKNVAKKEDD